MSPAIPRRPRPSPLVFAVAAAASACGSATDPASPTVAAVAGTYTLVSVAGNPMPAGILGTSSATIASGVTRTLDADGTCREAGTYTSYNPNVPPYPAVSVDTGTVMRCTWALAGRTVTFRLVSGLPSWFAATTTAAVGVDGTLTETGPDASGYAVYPRTYRR